jgi:ABC-2 type transport system permease protein
MLLFSAGMLIIRDIEDKSISRLKLTKMTVFDYVSGVTFTQILVGIVSVISTYFLATLFGFRSSGSIGSVIVICMVAFIGIIGMTFIVVSFCKNATIFVIAGQFPLFVLVFFTGAMMPMPRNALFNVFGNGICWNDFLPVGMSVTSLNAVFNDGKSIFDLKFPIIYSFIISALYLVIGLYLFHKKHLRLKS